MAEHAVGAILASSAYIPGVGRAIQVDISGDDPVNASSSITLPLASEWRRRGHTQSAVNVT
jgi:hypothetical protein